jgi:hypothetical protein
MAPEGGLEGLGGVWVYFGVKHLLQGSRDFGVLEPLKSPCFGVFFATRRISDKFANMPLKPQDIGTEERKLSTSSGRLLGNSGKIQQKSRFLRQKGIES